MVFGLRKAIALPHVPHFSGYPENTLRVPWDPQGNQEGPDTLTPESVTDDNDNIINALMALTPGPKEKSSRMNCSVWCKR